MESQPDGMTQQQQQPCSSRPLRFVTSYGAPHPKRRRVGAACLNCRKRKTACSGERPRCHTCKEHKLDCAGYSSGSPPFSRNDASADFGATSRKRRISPKYGHKTRSGSSHELDGYKFQATKDSADASKAPRPASPPLSQPTRAQSNFLVTPADSDHPRESLLSGPPSRMPYFRWLGPTAIMPGFKQMVVKIKQPDADLRRSSPRGAAAIPSPQPASLFSDQRLPSIQESSTAATESDMRATPSLPFYDASEELTSDMITNLVHTFFSHLGCNYPFLQRRRFLRDLEQKTVDSILVDAVCALAARFSTSSMFAPREAKGDFTPTPAEYGHVFAQRAKAALVDTFACPTVAAVQAAILIAYNEFGESRDSGLWMYSGIAIRLAQDLGMHTLEGLRYKGLSGVTPKTVSMQAAMATPSGHVEEPERPPAHETSPIPGQYVPLEPENDIEEQMAVEQERVDTFWAVFFVDRVLSSGTGRRSTLRDKDIELSFPPLDESQSRSGWPAPYPALIRLTHLYGRVADLLNGLKEPGDMTSDTSICLGYMENQVTSFYQGLSNKLHFDAVNFQHYVKTGEGTNFVLLHFWFHTLIVLLHQPTLLKTFEGPMLQLFPNSQQLSMSSAKTIADILSYSQLIDAKACLGNPFTTQPIYIAACAFLRETAEHAGTSDSQSRASSSAELEAVRTRSAGVISADATARQSAPAEEGHAMQQDVVGSTILPKSGFVASSKQRTPTAAIGQRTLAKNNLLATAASQHYQLCYNALRSLETYWAGTKYILTVLDQKFEGVGDPLLYTAEEGESAMERPKPDPIFTTPGWRRKLSSGRDSTGSIHLGTSTGKGNENIWSLPEGNAGDIGADVPKAAIGWTLTGTINSPSTSLAWHYPSGGGKEKHHSASTFEQSFALDTSVPFVVPQTPTQQRASRTHHTRTGSSTSQLAPVPARRSLVSGSLASSSAMSDASLLLGLGASYPQTSPPSDYMSYVQQSGFGSRQGQQQHQHLSHGLLGNYAALGPGPPMTYAGDVQDFGDMTIESQDVDMSMLGLDALPWFDSLYAEQHEDAIGSFGS